MAAEPKFQSQEGELADVHTLLALSADLEPEVLKNAVKFISAVRASPRFHLPRRPTPRIRRRLEA